MKLLAENSDWHQYYDYVEDYDAREVLMMIKRGDNLWTPLINPSMYQQALNEFTKFGSFQKFPTKYIYQWMGIVMKNTAIIRAITELAGHDVGFPSYAVMDVFFGGDGDKWEEYRKSLGHKGNFSPDFGWMGQEEDDYNEEDEVDDTEAATQYLEDNDYYRKMVLPDGSDAWSDYGLQPLETIILEYSEDLEPEKVLVLINRALDVTHQRGDLASAFIEGGWNTLSKISNYGYINENINKNKNMKEELKPYIEHLKPMFELIKGKFNIDVPHPKVVFELKKQNCNPILIKTGYFDPDTNKIHIFLCDDKAFRSVKDVARSFCHECIHYFQKYNGTIGKSGYKGDKISEDKALVRLEAEAYLKGNLYFREYTEKLQKKL